MPLVIFFTGTDPPCGDDLPTIGHVIIVYGHKAPSVEKAVDLDALRVLESLPKG